MLTLNKTHISRPNPNLYNLVSPFYFHILSSPRNSLEIIKASCVSLVTQEVHYFHLFYSNIHVASTYSSKEVLVSVSNLIHLNCFWASKRLDKGAIFITTRTAFRVVLA
jgi:hypothetical protein